MLSVPHIASNIIMTGELEGFWRKFLSSNIILSWHLHGETEQDHEKNIQDSHCPGWNMDQDHSKYSLEHDHYANLHGETVLWISGSVMNSFNHRPGPVFIFMFYIKLNSVLTQAGFTGTSHLIFAAVFSTLPSSVTYWTHCGYWEYVTSSSRSPVLTVNALDVFNSSAEPMIIVTILKRCNSSSGVQGNVFEWHFVTTVNTQKPCCKENCISISELSVS
jgi:hypothetical protein